jgi:very-short-patch-repair endonuclease
MNTDYFKGYLPTKTVKEYLAAIPDQQAYELFYDGLARPIPPIPGHLSFFSNFVETLKGGKTNEQLNAEYRARTYSYEQQMKTYYKIIKDNSGIIKSKCVDSWEVLFRVLRITTVSQTDVEASYSLGTVSRAETELFSLLKRNLENQCSVYHQVHISGFKNPFDILIFGPPQALYIVELDGYHHNVPEQYSQDKEKESQLRNMGIYVFRVGFDWFQKRKNETVEYVCHVARGNVEPHSFKKGFDNDKYVKSSEYSSETWNDYYQDEDRLYGSRDYYPNRQKPKDTYQQATILAKDSKDICYIYSQTTGVNKEKDQIVDICILYESINSENSVEHYSTIIPTCPISAQASKLHGFQETKLQKSPRLDGFIKQVGLYSLLQKRSTLLVTWDWNFMESILQNSSDHKNGWWTNNNKYNVRGQTANMYNLDEGVTLADTVKALGIAPEKYARYDSKEYVYLVREMYNKLRLKH